MKKRKKQRKPRMVLGALFAILMAAYLVFMISNIISPYNTQEKNPPFIMEEQSNIAIIDQLSLYDHDQTFIENVTNIFSSRGLSIDVFSSQEVTVGFYKNLPMRDYEIIIFRVHSAPYRIEPISNATPSQAGPSTYLFTSEPYSPIMYPMEQLSGRIVQAAVTKASPYYFAIGPEFIRKSMRGSFNNSLIIMSSCKILHESDLADAFIHKGAKGVISWNDLVELDHTDKAVESLIRNLFIEKMTIKEAVETTMDEVGPDPSYGSRLVYYPEKIGEEGLDELILTSNKKNIGNKELYLATYPVIE